MIQLVLAIALLGQVQAPRAYTVADPINPDQVDLATETGLLSIALGPGCDWVAPDMNVQWLPGSANVGALQPMDSSGQCNIAVTGRISDQPCAMDEDGVCDVASEADQ